MPKVIQLPRVAAEGLNNPVDLGCWVTITEPGCPAAKNENITCPKLECFFHDVEEVWRTGNAIYFPPTQEQAKEIVDFLWIHRKENVLVNCAAGISRSGAVALFCETYLGHKWPKKFKDLSWPNRLLFRLMENAFLDTELNHSHFPWDIRNARVLSTEQQKEQFLAELLPLNNDCGDIRLVANRELIANAPLYYGTLLACKKYLEMGDVETAQKLLSRI